MAWLMRFKVWPKALVKNRVLFAFVALVSVYVVIELMSLVTFVLVADDASSLLWLQRRRDAVRESPGLAPAPDERSPTNAPASVYFEVIHPYLGYVADPTKRLGVNSYGFPGSPPPFQPATSGDTVVVAVVGGSVAEGLLGAREPLVRLLKEARPFVGKAVAVYSFALGGMKQPQQLMIVSYLMSLGARFDLVINLDGFNEVVLPVVENEATGTFPFYPRLWKVRVGDLRDADLLRRAGRIALLESLRFRAAGLGSTRPLRYSMTVNLVWYLVDHGLVRRMASDRADLTLELLAGQDAQEPGRSYAATGPSRTYASDEARYADLAAYWKRASVLLNNLARGTGFQYFHFLQPNQYVADSKIFSAEERAIALPEGHPYAAAARRGYPYLIEAGKELVSEGVPYTDLTMLFAGKDEILYLDGCCHLNARGNELMALEVGRTIRDALNR